MLCLCLTYLLIKAHAAEAHQYDSFAAIDTWESGARQNNTIFSFAQNFICLNHILPVVSHILKGLSKKSKEDFAAIRND